MNRQLLANQRYTVPETPDQSSSESSRDEVSEYLRQMDSSFSALSKHLESLNSTFRKSREQTVVTPSYMLVQPPTSERTVHPAHQPTAAAAATSTGGTYRSTTHSQRAKQRAHAEQHTVLEAVSQLDQHLELLHSMRDRIQSLEQGDSSVVTRLRTDLTQLLQALDPKPLGQKLAHVQRNGNNDNLTRQYQYPSQQQQQQQVAPVKAVDEALEALEEVQSSLHNQVQQYEHKYQHLSELHQQQKSKWLSERQQLLTTIDSLKVKVKDRESKVEQLKQQWQQAQSRLKQFTEEEESVQARMETNEERLQSLQEHVATLQGQNVELRGQNQKYVSQVATLEKEVASNQLQVKRLQEQVSERDTTLATLQRQLKLAEKRVHKSSKQAEEVQAEFEREHNEVLLQRDQIAELQRDKKQLVEQLEQSQVTIHKFRLGSETDQQLLRQSESQLLQMRQRVQEVEALRALTEELSTKLYDKNSKLQAEQQKVKELRLWKEKQKQRVMEMKREIQLKSEKFLQVQKQLEELSQEYASSQEQLEMIRKMSMELKQQTLQSKFRYSATNSSNITLSDSNSELMNVSPIPTSSSTTMTPHPRLTIPLSAPASVGVGGGSGGSGVGNEADHDDEDQDDNNNDTDNNNDDDDDDDYDLRTGTMQDESLIDESSANETATRRSCPTCHQLYQFRHASDYVPTSEAGAQYGIYCDHWTCCKRGGADAVGCLRVCGCCAESTRLEAYIRNDDNQVVPNPHFTYRRVALFHPGLYQVSGSSSGRGGSTSGDGEWSCCLKSDMYAPGCQVDRLMAVPAFTTSSTTTSSSSSTNP